MRARGCWRIRRIHSAAERCGCVEGDAGPHPVDDPVWAYLDLEKLAAEPRVPGRRRRVRSLENMMALLLTGETASRANTSTWGAGR